MGWTGRRTGEERGVVGRMPVWEVDGGVNTATSVLIKTFLSRRVKARMTLVSPWIGLMVKAVALG